MSYVRFTTRILIREGSDALNASMRRCCCCFTTCRYRSRTVLLMIKRDNHQIFGPCMKHSQLVHPTMFYVRRGGGLTRIAPFNVQLDENSFSRPGIEPGSPG